MARRRSGKRAGEAGATPNGATVGHEAELQKFFCILEELESSRDLIKSGFGHLQEIDMGNTFYHLPHQLMASGLERFMKCYVLLMNDGRHGSYPDNEYVKRLGHDLQKLLKLIYANFYGGTERAWVQRELHFVTTDSVLADCIRILSLFGRKARYYNLDVVSGVRNVPIDPKEEWTALESRVEDIAPFLRSREALHREYYPRVHSRLIARIERLVRALAMQFTLGGHEDRNGTIGRLSSVYSEFRGMRDEELGTIDYRRSVHILRDRDKENWIKRSDREIAEGGCPIRVVARDEFEGDWPFRADRVVVERRDKIFYIVNIEGFAFSLNGAARSRFRIPEPHDAGVAVLGKSVSPFIDMASGLT